MAESTQPATATASKIRVFPDGHPTLFLKSNQGRVLDIVTGEIVWDMYLKKHFPEGPSES